MAKRILGIDLRVCAVKVVEVRFTAKGPVVEKIGSAEIPDVILTLHPDKEKAQAKAIKQILAKNNISTREAVFVISGSDLIIKKISLPPMPKSEIEQVIELQVKKTIDFPLNQAVYDYYPVYSKVAKGAKQTVAGDYVIAVTKKVLIEQVMLVGKLAGVNIKSISVVPIALQNSLIGSLNNDTTALVYMGKHSINISIFKGKEIEFNREVGIGGELITNAMTGVVLSEKGKIELDRDTAEKLKVTEGLPYKNLEEYSARTKLPADNLSAMIRPSLEKIEAEILRSLEFYGNPVDRFVLTGGSLKTVNLLEIIADSLKIKGEPGLPKISSFVDLSKDLPALSVAIGAAIEQGKKINLLPYDVKNRVRILIRKIAFNPILYTVLGLLLLANLYVGEYMVGVKLATQVLPLQQQMDKLTPQLKEFDELQAKLRGAPISEKEDRLIDLLNNLTYFLPSTIELDQISFSRANHSLEIFGKGTRTSVTKFMGRLKKSRLIKEVSLDLVKEVDLGTMSAFDFRIICELISW